MSILVSWGGMSWLTPIIFFFFFFFANYLSILFKFVSLFSFSLTTQIICVCFIHTSKTLNRIFDEIEIEDEWKTWGCILSMIQALHLIKKWLFQFDLQPLFVIFCSLALFWLLLSFLSLLHRLTWIMLLIYI